MKILNSIVLLAACLASPAAAQNLLVNPDFDLDPTDPANGWISEGTGAMSHVPGFGDPAPPSVRFDCDGAEWLLLWQCVGVVAGEAYDFSARSYTHSGSGAATNSVTLSFFSNPGCTGGWLTTVATDQQSFPNWALRWSTDVAAPVGAASAAVELAADANDWSMNISWDSVVVRMSYAVFSDGFESGGTSGWSVTVP